jgi:acetyltransferase-like isoleucine patch superfamily enzyme/NADP-dependent 3-hydroxy acid dehydrogenase YdfG
MSVFLSADDVRARIARFEGRISLASFNGPRSTVVSGEPEALAKLLVACEADGVRARMIAVDYASHSPQVDAIGDRLREDLAPIAPMAATIPILSTTTAERIDGAAMDAGHWLRNLREPVRFEQATRALLAEGVTTFIESSPHPVLTWALQETIDDACEQPGDVAVVGSLRRDEGTLARFQTSLGEAYVHGVTVDWEVAFAGLAPRRVTLPSYPFARTRFWLEPRRGGGDAAGLLAAGLTPAEHPLLGAAVALAGRDAWVWTGRVSLETHPWLADHELLGDVLLAGSVFAELALHAASHAGCDVLGELTLQAPLVLRAQADVALQVSVGEPDEGGARTFEVFAGDGSDWVRHASGWAGAAETGEHPPIEVWPPPGAVALDPDGLYEGLADRGFAYGPAFAALRAAWTHDDGLFAAVALAPEQADEAARYAIHPALLDAALHVAVARADDVRLAFSWSGVRVHRAGASALRVTIAPARAGDGGAGAPVDADSGARVLHVTATDLDGAPVLSIDRLVTRTVDPRRRGAACDDDGLLALRWLATPWPSATGRRPRRLATLGELTVAGTPAHADLAALRAALDGGGAPPGAVLARSPPSVAAALELLQGWLGEERLRTAELVLVTHGAMAVSESEAPDPDAAAVWGLVRSAQAEHPDRFALVDADCDEGVAAALGAGEQVAIRERALYVPRLERTRVDDGAPPTGLAKLDPGGTVLVTGGTGGLGALAARHLAERHGARHLLLASRRGPAAEGATELRGQLTELGCDATIAACDVGDRAALAALLDAIPAEHPLTAVVHTAGVYHDGLLESLDADAVADVMRSKADAARWLDELTADAELAAFVLYSSISGTFGMAGSSNYAAANAYLDALAQRRRAAGLAATSIAWGTWEQASGILGRLRTIDVERLGRTGQRAPLSAEHGLRLLDAAIQSGEAALVALPLDVAALRARRRAGTLAPLLQRLAPVVASTRAAAVGGSLAVRLAGVAQEERATLVLGLVRAQAAATLGHESADAVDASRSFRELGFDSLGAVELRNRLAQITGLRLASTVVFDRPTPLAMAQFLRAEAEAQGFDEAGGDGLADAIRSAAGDASSPAAQPASAAAPERAVDLAASPAASAATRRELALPDAPPPAVALAPTNGHADLAVSQAAHARGADGVGEGRRYGGAVLGSVAGAVRTLRFRAWVALARLRLARLGCRLVIEADGTPRFDALPHIAVDSIGPGQGSLTLRIGRDCRFGRDLTFDLQTHTHGLIEIAAGGHFQSRIRLQAWGGAIRLGPSVQVRDGSELKSKGELTAGAEVGIGRNVTIHCHERIELGDHVALAEGVTVMDSDKSHDGSDTHFQLQPIVSTPVLLEDNVLAGTNAVILRGARVGRNAVIATGAVVTAGEHPARHLLAGVPARPVRPLDA